MKFTYPGEIVPYVRVGQERWTKRARRYFASKDNLALAVQLQMRAQGWERLADKTQFEVAAHFTRRGFLTCDVDNLVKALLDALNGVAFDDDRYCVKLTATKARGEDFAQFVITEAE